jgi:rhodanese-related sulfurtransferase
MPIRSTLLKLIRRAAGAVVDPSAPSRATNAPTRAAPPAESAPPAAPEPPLEVENPLPDSVLLDIREPAELAGGVAEGAILIPMNCVPNALHRLDRARPITVYCAAGARSLGVAHWLREQGYSAVSLESGIQSLRWAKVPMINPDRAGERVTFTDSALLDGVAIGSGEILRINGNFVRLVDASGLETVGVFKP